MTPKAIAGLLVAVLVVALGAGYVGASVAGLVDQGASGANGAEGPQGPRGEQGAAGPRGEPGADGLPGELGPRGFTGAQGTTGAQGAGGPTGKTGATGLQGPQGQQGPTGPQGLAGGQNVLATGLDDSIDVPASTTTSVLQLDGVEPGEYVVTFAVQGMTVNGAMLCFIEAPGNNHDGGQFASGTVPTYWSTTVGFVTTTVDDPWIAISCLNVGDQTNTIYNPTLTAVQMVD